MRTKIAAALLAATALSGCAAYQPETKPKKPFYGPVPTITQTPADPALMCLAKSPAVRGSDTTFAVHVIQDSTNRFATEETGGFVPRDAAGMLVTALAKAGVKQVNRANTAVTEWEINRAKEQVLGDGRRTRVGNQMVTFRPLVKGSLRGSDVVIDGALTQLDFNTYSRGGEVTVGGIGGGVRVFALTVAADLRVTDTRSTEVLIADSYSKQAVGQEVFASVFRFFSDELYDVRIGDKSQEGLQAGVRWLLHEAAYDIVASITDHDGSCDRLLPEATRELRQEREVAAARINGDGTLDDVGQPDAPAVETEDDEPVLTDPDATINEQSQNTEPSAGPVGSDPRLGETVTVRLPDGRVVRSTLTEELLARGRWNADRTVFIVTQ
jgi:curli biogenesis system outer membrane secretion channel CsgG